MANFYMKEWDWKCLQNYAKYAYSEHKSEIGGMMIAEQDKENKWKLHKPVILKQKISGGNTVLCQEALSQYYVEMGMKMKNKPFQFVWWHSHHTMGVFWSGTDLTAIDEFANGNMSISLVINLKEEYKLRVNLWKPYKMHKDVDLDILRTIRTSKIPDRIVNEVEALCSKPVYVTNWRTNTRNYINGTQQTLLLGGNTMQEKPDKEMVDIEARVDNALQDYLNFGMDFEKYQADIKSINRQLKSSQSELRVGMCDNEDSLFISAYHLEPEDWIHGKHQNWSLENLVIERQIDVEMGDWNDSFNINELEGDSNVKSKI